MVRLINVYDGANIRAGAAELLFELLSERTPEQNISHKAMPAWCDHLKHLHGRPHEAWYLILHEDACVGAVYLTHARELGLFIFKKHQGEGFGTLVLAEMRRRHPGHFLANVAPGNQASQEFFLRNNFKLVQHTFKLEAE